MKGLDVMEKVQYKTHTKQNYRSNTKNTDMTLYDYDAYFARKMVLMQIYLFFFTSNQEH